jgi:hypothetical protein
MNKIFTKLGFAVVLIAFVAGCKRAHFTASRSSDDIDICRKFLAEAGIAMESLKRDTFRPQDLDFRQLTALTPTDPDYVVAEFLVLNHEWSYETNGTNIVIICAQAREIRPGVFEHYVGYNSGNCGWLDAKELNKLQWGDYVVLPKITHKRIDQ